MVYERVEEEVESKSFPTVRGNSEEAEVEKTVVEVEKMGVEVEKTVVEVEKTEV